MKFVETWGEKSPKLLLLANYVAKRFHVVTQSAAMWSHDDT